MTSREQQAQQTYENIMLTTENLLETTSFEELSVSEICEKAGVSKGGFYHHFSSKDQLMALLVGRQMERLIHQQVSPLVGKEDAFTLLNLYIETGLIYLKDSPGNTLARCWLALSEHSELTKPRFSQTYFKLLHDIVLQGNEEGSFRTDISPEFCESFIAATFTGIMLHAIAYSDEQPIIAFVKQSMQLLCEILKKTD